MRWGHFSSSDDVFAKKTVKFQRTDNSTAQSCWESLCHSKWISFWSTISRGFIHSRSSTLELKERFGLPDCSTAQTHHCVTSQYHVSRRLCALTVLWDSLQCASNRPVLTGTSNQLLKSIFIPFELKYYYKRHISCSLWWTSSVSPAQILFHLNTDMNNFAIVRDTGLIWDSHPYSLTFSQR